MAREEVLSDHLNKRNSCPIFKKQNRCLHTSQIELLLYQGWLMGKTLLGSAQKREGEKKIVAGHIYLSIVEQLILLKLTVHCHPPHSIPTQKPKSPNPTGQTKQPPSEPSKACLGKSCPSNSRLPPLPAQFPNKRELFQPLIEERCNSNKQKRMGVKFPNPQKHKVGKAICAGANPLSAIKLLDLLKLSYILTL